jgi:ribose transport system substrate-binding protein
VGTVLDPGSQRVKGESPAWRTAIELLVLLSVSDGAVATGEAVARLGTSRSTLNRLCRILAQYELLDLPRRGRIALGPTALALASRREDLMRVEDERRLAPRRKPLARAPGASYSLIRNPDCSVVAHATRSRRSRKFRLGFSNASLDHPWRTALVHSVEYGAVRSNDLVSSFAVRHARLDAARQARDVAELLKSGVDGLIISAHDSVSLTESLSEAERQGVPVVLVDRGRPDILPHVCFVTCDDHAIGDITARWMAERLRGRGSIILLPGLFQAEPAQRRLDGARAVFARYPGLRIVDVCWTGWQEEIGREIIATKLADGRDTIDGVWCDSGLQAVGSLRAYIARPGEAARSRLIQEATSIWPTSSRSDTVCRRRRSTIRQPWACARWKLYLTCCGVDPSLAALTFRLKSLSPGAMRHGRSGQTCGRTSMCDGIYPMT